MQEEISKTSGNGEYVAIENQEWRDSIDYVLSHNGKERAAELLEHTTLHAQRSGANHAGVFKSAYLNTIHAKDQQPYPGNEALEEEIEKVLRFNAMTMVVKANKNLDGIGGHISTYASLSTIWDVAFNHFIRGHEAKEDRDLVYYQGHASPGIYARAHLEGRLDETTLDNFRRELAIGGGLSSYPHPWLMPDFWEFPTVSMGLAPIMAIYQARFNRYLEARGLKPEGNGEVWAFLGDGESDEPETTGAIGIAAYDKLDNLTFIFNCNLQRLDGPVWGNGKIVQELEGRFRGAGWNVIKVLWSKEWDELFEKDTEGRLEEKLRSLVDGGVCAWLVMVGIRAGSDEELDDAEMAVGCRSGQSR